MPKRMSEAWSSRRSKTYARSPSSSGRQRSTTSVSCRRSSASARPSPNAAASRPSSQANVQERLSPEVEITLYRVVQEALTNVVKHSGAEHVSIVISNREGSVAATIDDDGRGFDSAEVRQDALGLLGMRERLALVGGTLEVESSAGVRDDDRRSGPAPARP